MKINIFTLLLMMATLIFVNCSKNNVPVEPDPDPDPVYVPPSLGDGNIGPRANTYDDPADGIYVSPTGNDATADGSIGKPYRSINTALGKARSGATIILRSGTYRE